MNTSTSTRPARIATWTAQILAAAILGSTLPFKLLGAQESVELFRTLGAEPFGRLTLGGLELVAVVLLLIPRTAIYGGLLTSGLLVGAVLAHVTVLGIVYPNDASLFTMAVVGLASGLVVSWIRRREIPVLGALFGAGRSAGAVS